MTWWDSDDRDRRQREPRDREAEERAAWGITMLTGSVILSVAWPVLAVMFLTVAAAWLAGLHHARLLHAALWALPGTAVYIIAATIQDRPWEPGRLKAWAQQPYHEWRTATVNLIHGHHIAAALLTTAPAAIPAGMAAGAGMWAWRSHQMTHGLMGTTALAPVGFEARQWHRQAATAARDARQPGRVPLTARHGVPVGTVIRVIRARWSRTLVIPLTEFARHMVIVGATGSGKTTLMTRLWAGWMAAALDAFRSHGEPRPLLVVLDGKGGHDSRAVAVRARYALSVAGASRVALWPDVPLNMWDLPARELSVLLHQLIEHGTDSAAYYADISQAAITLAVHAPPRPPRSARDFLYRLSAGWLERAYADAGAGVLVQVAAARPHLGDIAMRYTVLLDRLGDGLDSGGTNTLEDADAWYCILEGTAEPSVAEAQAMALIELVARAAAAPRGPRRRILLACDDYSAVSRRVPLANLYERGRSLGLGVQVSAQSWEGLGADDDERRRITATADGGIWVLRTPSPENLIMLAGTQRVLESGRKLLGAGRTGDEGTSRVAHQWLVDPDRIRQLAPGQAANIRHGGATFVHITPAPAITTATSTITSTEGNPS